MIGETVALDAEARLPTPAALVRLVSPFEQVKPLDFLGDMLDVGLGEFSRPQEFSLLSTPREKIAIVKRAVGQHNARIIRSCAPRPSSLASSRSQLSDLSLDRQLVHRSTRDPIRDGLNVVPEREDALHLPCNLRAVERGRQEKADQA
jgi:hypothetical protein